VIEPTELEVVAVPSGAPADLEIVPMRRRHLRGVLRIEVQSYPKPWTYGLYLSELALGGLRCYLVARSRGEVVGYGGVMYIGPDAHVTTLATAPEFHRRGIAGRVLLGLARAAVAHGAENLTLEVRVTNEAAIALYRRYGFAPAGVRKNYYAEVNEDALVMWANDIHAEEYAARLDRLGAELDPTGTAAPAGPVPAGPGSSGEEAR
jgi:ribosomal-protein-alanine N-acetyltransferase